MADVGLEVVDAVGLAVILHRVVERGRAVEVGRRRELHVVPTICTVPPTTLAKLRDGQRLRRLVAGTLAVVAGQRGNEIV